MENRCRAACSVGRLTRAQTQSACRYAPFMSERQRLGVLIEAKKRLSMNCVSTVGR